MSDLPQGEGWWQASDGLWYSPEQHPDHRPQAGPAPSPPRTSSAGLFDAIPPGAVRSGDAGGSESSEDLSGGWFSRWGKWAVLGAAILPLLGVAGAMVGSGGDDPVSEVASATTIRRVPEPSTTTTTTTSSVTTTTTPSIDDERRRTSTTITTPGPPEKSISLSGTGDAVLDFETPNADSYVATLTHSGEGTFTVDVLDREGEPCASTGRRGR